jgi:hypothetical protein
MWYLNLQLEKLIEGVIIKGEHDPFWSPKGWRVDYLRLAQMLLCWQLYPAIKRRPTVHLYRITNSWFACNPVFVFLWGSEALNFSEGLSFAFVEMCLSTSDNLPLFCFFSFVAWLKVQIKQIFCKYQNYVLKNK